LPVAFDPAGIVSTLIGYGDGKSDSFTEAPLPVNRDAAPAATGQGAACAGV
jgi:hypothetical protein